MDLSVIIVNYRTRGLLPSCLASLRRAQGALHAEYLIVDNDTANEGHGNEDGDPGVRWIRNGSNLGFARAVNEGLALAAGRHILLVNPDVRLLHGSLGEALFFLDDHPKAAALGFRLMDPDGRLQPSCRRFPGWTTPLAARRSILSRCLPANPLTRHYLMADFDHALPSPVDWVSGSFLWVRRDALEAVGGLDERFFLFCEDVDLCLRLWRSGREVWYLPWIEGCHIGGASSRHRPLSSLWDHHRSMWAYYRKHRRGGRLTDLLVAGGVTLRALAGTVEHSWQRS